MRLSKREFLALSGATAGLALVGTGSANVATAVKTPLKSIVGDAKPISVEERQSRIDDFW